MFVGCCMIYFIRALFLKKKFKNFSSQQSPRIGLTLFWFCLNNSSIFFKILNKFISEVSNIYKFFGECFNISIQSSPPIEPPPPVTSIFLL